jgi:hypothetical protein
MEQKLVAYLEFDLVYQKVVSLGLKLGHKKEKQKAGK